MPLQFYFFLNHVLHKTGRTPGEPTGEPLAFSHLRTFIVNNFLLNTVCSKNWPFFFFF
jgi:hypothetical protein